MFVVKRTNLVPDHQALYCQEKTHNWNEKCVFEYGDLKMVYLVGIGVFDSEEHARLYIPDTNVDLLGMGYTLSMLEEQAENLKRLSEGNAPEALYWP